MSSRRITAMVACLLMAVLLAENYLFSTVQQAGILYDGEVKIDRPDGDESFVLNAKSGRSSSLPC
jgi:hypothetical protein